MRPSDPKIDPIRGFALPPELARSVPRDVSLTRGGRALVVVEREAIARAQPKLPASPCSQ